MGLYLGSYRAEHISETPGSTVRINSYSAAKEVLKSIDAPGQTTDNTLLPSYNDFPTCCCSLALPLKEETGVFHYPFVYQVLNTT